MWGGGRGRGGGGGGKKRKTDRVKLKHRLEKERNRQTRTDRENERKLPGPGVSGPLLTSLAKLFLLPPLTHLPQLISKTPHISPTHTRLLAPCPQAWALWGGGLLPLLSSASDPSRSCWP